MDVCRTGTGVGFCCFGGWDEDAEVEFRLARELMALSGYERWENFEKVVKRRGIYLDDF